MARDRYQRGVRRDALAEPVDAVAGAGDEGRPQSGHPAGRRHEDEAAPHPLLQRRSVDGGYDPGEAVEVEVNPLQAGYFSGTAGSRRSVWFAGSTAMPTDSSAVTPRIG